MAIPRAGGGASASANDLVARLTRHADLGLAAVVVASVAMMIVPLPGFLLDLLISFNIAVAVTLLLISIYVADALKIATFPTLLLLTTLFRVALEVSATRLILLKANAGEVIHAFGGFVVAGNLVVGAVIFVILTLVQFIVIAKGAERVAEVAARFTLDALPGKQMAIDAELRAGLLDAPGAQRRRATLARESQFFGSMDGAMRFVKGDAVAGIIVLAVNIVGGLVIGVAQRGMELASAARTYTLLTIGEGLVAQIPALVISTAAGIVVTRVAAEDEGAHLGREIGAQVLAQPKALAVAAALLALLGLVPGLPATPFLVLAAALGSLAWRLLTRRQPPTATSSATAATSPVPTVRPPAPRLTPLAVELSPSLAAELHAASADGAFAGDALDTARVRLFEEAGLTLPSVRLRAADIDDALPGRSYRIHFNEIPLPRADLARDRSDAGAEIAADLGAPDAAPRARADRDPRRRRRCFRRWSRATRRWCARSCPRSCRRASWRTCSGACPPRGFRCDSCPRSWARSPARRLPLAIPRRWPSGRAPPCAARSPTRMPAPPATWPRSRSIRWSRRRCAKQSAPATVAGTWRWSRKRRATSWRASGARWPSL